MTKHIADHRTPPQGGRLIHFLRITRDKSEAAWRSAWQRSRETDGGHRRVVEYVRIARGRQV